MAKQPLPKELSAKFAEYLKLRKEAKESGNAQNRQKTVLKNIFKDGYKANQFRLGTHVILDGVRFDYNQTQSDYIDVEDFFKLYEEKKITREQLLKCISVGKGNVETHVGSDVALELTQSKTGKEFDVRVTDLPIDAPKESVIVIPEEAKRITRKKVKPQQAAPAKATIRRLKPASRIKTKK